MRRLFEKASLPFEESQLLLLEEYVRLLLDWNKKVNLISRKDEENVWYSHIVHSLLPLTLVQIPPGLSLLDLGSGGGLPGIPMAIVRPDLRLTLLDSIRKKTTAVDDMVLKLGLPNVKVLTGRAEELQRQSTERFDIVIARAVAPLVDLIKWSRPLVRRPVASGTPELPLPALLAMKGGDLAAELEQARIKTRAAGIRIHALNFDIPDPSLLEEKKLCVVPLT